MTDNPKFDLVNAKLTAEALLGPDFPAYWQALGCFVDRFTGVELNLQTLLWLFAGVPMPTAQAVFRNTSANRAIEIIWRVAEAQNWTEGRKAQLKPIFDQLDKINKLRNDLLHLGAKCEGEGRWAISNQLLAHTEKKIRTQTITIPILKAATVDLTSIELRLTLFAFADQMSPEARTSFEAETKLPWRYTP
jgi:hypothetical protein